MADVFRATARYGGPNRLDEEMLFDLIERQCADGIAFMAVHCGINLYTMCGDFCANKASAPIFEEALRNGAKA